LLEVTARGTFEQGVSTLQLRHEPDDLGRWSDVRARLLAARDRRPQPSRDDKAVASWNGLAIAALSEAGVLLDEPSWTQAAVAAASLVVDVHWDGSRLARVSRDAVVGSPPGVLEDYACLADGLLVLGGLTGQPRWISVATRMLDVALEIFVDGDQVYDTAADATDERLGRRPTDPTDNAYPSGRSAFAHALLRAGAVTGEARYRAAGDAALGTAQALATRAPRFVSWALAAAEASLVGPVEVAVVGEADDPSAAMLLRTSLRHAPPGSAVVVGAPDPDGTSDVPLLRHRDLVEGQPAVYVCRGFACRVPVTTPDDVAAELTAAARGGRT
jgi:uncharacterized protein YyaL (SSP411 family)